MGENAKADCEELLNFQLPFAERMLANYGEFIPFGAKLMADGELIAVAGDTGEEHPLSQDVIDLLRNAFLAEANTGAIIATAVTYGVRVNRPGTSIKTDAVALALDHCSGYSIEMFVPYSIDGGQVTFDAAFGNVGDNLIFPA